MAIPDSSRVVAQRPAVTSLTPIRASGLATPPCQHPGHATSNGCDGWRRAMRAPPIRRFNGAHSLEWV